MLTNLICGGYVVYYSKTESNKIVGYCVVSRGGGRLKISSRRDIVIGPIRIDSNVRNKGYASRLIHSILHDFGIDYEKAYEFIHNGNIASIKVAEKNGFCKIFEAEERGITRVLVQSDNGAYGVWCYEKDAR